MTPALMNSQDPLPGKNKNGLQARLKVEGLKVGKKERDDLVTDKGW